MSYIANNGVQVQEYVWDFDVDGGAVSTIDLSAKARKDPLPDNAIVHKVIAWVETAATSAGSATLEWGNTTDPNGYSGATVAVAALTVDSLHNGFGNAAALIWDDTDDHEIPFICNAAADRDFSVTIATAAMTAGKIRFLVHYVLPGAE